MAKKKAEGSDEIRVLIIAHPTWSDAQIHGALKADGSVVTIGEVADTRAQMGAKHTWKD